MDMDSGVAVTGEQPAAPRLWSLDRLRRQMIDAGFGDVYDRLFNARPSRVAPTSWPPPTYALTDVGDGPGGDGDGNGKEGCAICLCRHRQQGDAAGWKETPCRHRFHGGCLDKWLRAAHARTTCPLCRREIPTLPPAADEEDAAAAGTVAFGNGRVAILFEAAAPDTSQAGMAMDVDETDDEDNQDIDGDDVIEDSDDDGGAEEDHTIND